MLSLKTRTGYSFRRAFGPLHKVIEACEGDAIGIADYGGTWGHVAFSQICLQHNKKPIFGASIPTVEEATEKSKQPANEMTFFARNGQGLKELYSLVTKANSKSCFYYNPRISYQDLFDVSDDIIMLSGATPLWPLLPMTKKKNLYIELNPMSSKKALDFAKSKGMKTVATSDNFYPTVKDRRAYEIAMGVNHIDRTTPMHILNEWEWRDAVPWAPEEAISNTHEIANLCNAELPTARMVSFNSDKTLRQLCDEGALQLKIDLNDRTYIDRLEQELLTITEKGFEAYFFVIADMVNYAKQHGLLVGPGRGSAAGSLVCYLTGITDVDPIKHKLLFERFLDATRSDPPDIDVDFPDDRRELIFEYIRKKYGAERVAHLGAISSFKARSTITEVAKALGIPTWDVDPFKNFMGNGSVEEAFRDLDAGQELLAKHPGMKLCMDLEGHPRHCSVHAAGVVITERPISDLCSFSEQTGAAQIDKKGAESLGLLKIDALGLRTLSVIQRTLDQVGWTRQDLVDYPLDDEKAFGVISRGLFAGVFQFEGHALQDLTKRSVVTTFDDIAALSALARPGPLTSGAAQEYVKRRTGEVPIKFLHPSLEELTKDTLGVVVYQEQVMQIARVGKLSWEAVSDLRRAMSRSLGQELFDAHFDQFEKGAKENGIDEPQYIWDHLNTMGSWAFNRSHAIAYGLLSYWCCVLKSRFPLEFAAACLQNTKDDDQTVGLLREVVKEGLVYRAFDKVKSKENWSVQGGELIGGLLGIKGIGPKMAKDIITRRTLSQPLTPRQTSLLETGTTPYDEIFECKRRFGHMKEDPSAHNIVSPITDIADLDPSAPGTFVFFGKLKAKNLRNINDYGARAEKNNIRLECVFEDDTGYLPATVDRFRFSRLGKPIAEEGNIGDWYLVRGKLKSNYRKIYIDKWRKLS